jgi:hypothetical protein
VLRRAAPHLGVTYVELMIAAGYLTTADVDEWERSGRATAAQVVQTASR